MGEPLADRRDGRQFVGRLPGNKHRFGGGQIALMLLYTLAGTQQRKDSRYHN